MVRGGLLLTDTTVWAFSGNCRITKHCTRVAKSGRFQMDNHLSRPGECRRSPLFSFTCFSWKTTDDKDKSMRSIQCPNCAREIEFAHDEGALKVTCPSCLHRFQLPHNEFSLLLSLEKNVRSIRRWAIAIFFLVLVAFLFLLASVS